MQAFIPPVAGSAFSPPPLQDARAVGAQEREATRPRAGGTHLSEVCPHTAAPTRIPDR